MKVPAAFNKLCSCFHQDIGVDTSNPEEWIAFALAHLEANERLAAKAFLNELLSGPHDEIVLQNIWFGTGADVYFPEGDDLRKFLQLIRESIE